MAGRAFWVRVVVVSIAVLALLTSAPAAQSADPFPEPETLRSAVAFWMRVYLEITTNGGLLHDSRHLGVVYETVRFTGAKSNRARQRQIDQRRRHWKNVLNKLAKGNAPETAVEQRIVQSLEAETGKKPTKRDFAQAARRVRFQLGQRDKFRAGLIRSGAYDDEMRATFREMGLPEALANLPHVESSFNVRAYSKYGAAGIWQFMRTTGRRYMDVNYVVDQRLDPSAATVAAAELLRDNYAILKSWPLAVTAYNHGASGMRRAVRKLGTNDIGEIAMRYKSRTFGFASRNFYAQFLAANRIVGSYESYFGPLRREVPEAVDEIELPFYADINDVSTHLGVQAEVIQHYNPALRPSVFRSGKRIPKDYRLRLPAGTVVPNPTAWLASVPEARRFNEQYRNRYHRVRRGESLSLIARRYKTSASTLVAINNLRSRHKIYAGQVLTLPDGPQPAKPPSRGLVASAHAAPAKAVVSPAAIRPAGPIPDVPHDSPMRAIKHGRIRVDAGETLGHYAEWLGIGVQRLRNLNGLSRRSTIRLGQRLKLDFRRVTPEKFAERRTEHHKGVEEDFFVAYEVTGTVAHTLASGESLWVLSHRVYAVPTWLIQRYNPEADLTRLAPGAVIQIPVVEAAGRG